MGILGSQGIQGPEGGVGPLYRYDATATTGEVEVLASATGVTASINVGARTLTMTIPSGTRVLSLKVRPGFTFSPGAQTFIVDMGTTDMTNGSAATRWPPAFQVFNESTGAFVATASCSMNAGPDFSKYTITNVPASVTVVFRLVF